MLKTARGEGTRGETAILVLLLSGPAFLRRRLVHHAFELHAVGIGEIDGIIRTAVIFAGRIDHVHPVLVKKSAARVHVLAAPKLQSVVGKTDIAPAGPAPSAPAIARRESRH